MRAAGVMPLQWGRVAEAAHPWMRPAKLLRINADAWNGEDPRAAQAVIGVVRAGTTHLVAALHVVVTVGVDVATNAASVAQLVAALHVAVTAGVDVATNAASVAHLVTAKAATMVS